jgi:ubiquinone biosynthesis monooxygenase Coq7
MLKRLSLLDRAVVAADRALRAATSAERRTVGGSRPEGRHRPPPGPPAESCPLAAADRERSVRLMRVNHAGEVAAQALYLGQAAVARDESTRSALLNAGAEERDHLDWCEARLRELGGSTSLLSPLWYAGSLAIGATAGLTGDRWSLGFVAETERQVEEHLTEHLARLPAADARSRAILEQMQADEMRHGEAAMQAGGAPLPTPVRSVMTQVARVMTRTAYWF